LRLGTPVIRGWGGRVLKGKKECLLRKLQNGSVWERVNGGKAQKPPIYTTDESQR